MPEPPSNSQPAPDPQEATAPSKPLVGGATIRELERRDRELRDQAKRAERVGLWMRVVASVVLILVVALLALSWRQLESARSVADRDLQAIHSELDLQLTEVLRYVPFDDKTELAARRDLNSARADLASSALRTRVRGIHAVRKFLTLRLPSAKDRVQREWAPLYGDFISHHRESDAIIRSRSKQFNAAAARYNRLAAAFPASLVRQLLGYPEKLPAL